MMFNKKKEYTVITNMVVIKAVREFANKHVTEGREIDVHVHGCLLDDDNLVTVTFTSDEEEAVIYSEFIDTFNENFKIALRRKLIFVFDKDKEEES